MRKLTALAAVALFAACGSDSDSAPTVTGTVGGRPFTMQEAASSQLASSNCVVQTPDGPLPLGVSVAAVQIADHANVCSSVQTCALPANTSGVNLFIVRASLTSGGVPPGINAQAYPWADLATLGTNPNPPLDTQLNIRFFTGLATSCGAAGTGVGAPVPVTGGTVTVTSIGATSISGTVNAQLAGGGSIQGSFEAPNCALGAPDLCGLIANPPPVVSFCPPTAPTTCQ